MKRFYLWVGDSDFPRDLGSIVLDGRHRAMLPISPPARSETQVVLIKFTAEPKA